MRASTLLVGSAIVSCAAVAISACSSDAVSSTTSTQTSPADVPPDASSSPDLDAGLGDPTDASSDAARDAAPEVEQIAVRFGGVMYKLNTIARAEVGASGIAAVSANEGVEKGAAIDLAFDPKTGTIACAADSNAKVVFTATPSEVYQAGECSIVVTQFGGVGGAIDGTFKATVKGSNGTAATADGTFHVLRKN